MWLTTEGVFGVALGVSTNFVFMFVLFGTLLERAGAGSYFIQLAFSLLGNYRGGPAKAGVVASGLTGMISGSSIANVVTTGTFTIPLMKKVGYPPTKAGAIECAAGVNGQIMPPVMGAAAFLIAEYVGIPYSEVVKHAFFPALLTYGSLFYIVDIEAMKMGLTGLPPRSARPRVPAAAARADGRVRLRRPRRARLLRHRLDQGRVRPPPRPGSSPRPWSLAYLGLVDTAPVTRTCRWTTSTRRLQRGAELRRDGPHRACTSCCRSCC